MANSMKTHNQLLLVEDDTVLTYTIKDWLSSSGFNISSTHSGIEASELLAKEKYDLVILDLGLPGMDGLDVLTKMRTTQSETPVIITTARDSLSHKVTGLNAGADDYLTKPFELSELEARINAILRRKGSVDQSPPSFGSITMDRNLLDGFINSERLFLTTTEYQLLLTLVQNGSSVTRKEDLCMSNGEKNGMSENTLEVNLYRLRKKLGSSEVTIKSIRGVGYCLISTNE